MFRDSKLELRVGLFIGAGIFLMCFLFFSIKDMYYGSKGYKLGVVFDYVNGISRNAPVRVTGVNAGEVHDVRKPHSPHLRRERVEGETG